MDILKFCKICLVQNVRLFATQGPLGNYLKELLGHKILYSSNVPPYICYECAYLLEKCIRFKEKCLLGQNVIFEILQDRNEITKEDILSVDRMKKNLVSSLKVSPITKDYYFEFQHEEADFDQMDDRFDAGDDPFQPFIKDEKVTQLDDDDFQKPHGQDDIEMRIKCVICHKDMSYLNTCGVKKKELKVMKRISSIQGDGLFSLLNSTDEVKIHAKCKKKYCQIELNFESNSAKDNLKAFRCSAYTLQKEEYKPRCSTLETVDFDITIDAMDCEYSETDTKEINPEPKSKDATEINKMQFCVICHETLMDESKVVAIKELEMFKKVSLLRKDGLYNFFNSVDEVNVHEKCQDLYSTDGNYLKLLFSDGNSLSTENNDDFNEEDKKCVICRGIRNDTFQTLNVMAVERLKKYSLLRNDGLFYFFNSIDELSLHHKCRKNYTRINPRGIYIPLKLIPKPCKPKPGPESSITKILRTSSLKDNIKSLRSSANTLKKEENEQCFSTSGKNDIDVIKEPMDCEYPEIDTKEIHPKPKSKDSTEYNKTQFCVICHELLTDESKVAAVKVLEIFKKFSLLRNDGLYNFFNSVDEVNVHDKCQEAYTADGNYLKIIFSVGNNLNSENDDDFSEEDQKCVICRGTRKDTFQSLKVVAVERLKKSSMLRNDGLFYFFDSIDEVKVHQGCRIEYNRINPKGIYRPLKLIPESCKPKPNPEPSKTKKRKKLNYRVVYGPIKEFPITELVDYDLCCFICTRKLRPEKEKKMSLSNQRVIHTIIDRKSKEEIIKGLQKLTIYPEYSEYQNVNETIERISKLDLDKLGVKCHMNCYNDILNPRTDKIYGHRRCNEAMDDIYKYIEEVGEDSEFTISELCNVLTGDYVPQHRTIKANLKRHYKDQVTFVAIRHDTVVMFKT